MSAEYDDVLTNQPVVIDNVCDIYCMPQWLLIALFLGLRDYQGGIRRARPPEMLLSVIVRCSIFARRSICVDIMVLVSVDRNIYALWRARWKVMSS